MNWRFFTYGFLLGLALTVYYYSKQPQTFVPAETAVKTRTNVQTRTREVIKPNGERIIETVKRERSNTQTTVRNKASNWLVGPTYSLQDKKIGLDVNRRILDKVWVGVEFNDQIIKGEGRLKILIEF